MIVTYDLIVVPAWLEIYFFRNLLLKNLYKNVPIFESRKLNVMEFSDVIISNR